MNKDCKECGGHGYLLAENAMGQEAIPCHVCRYRAFCKHEGKPLEEAEIDYVNHRGQRRWRRIHPERVWYGATEHHVTGWLLDAVDIDRGVRRTFAMRSVFGWRDLYETPS